MPPLPSGIPLVPTGVPLRTDCIGVSFWIFEFVRYWAVYRPYRSVYRYRGSAVRHSGSVGRTLVGGRVARPRCAADTQWGMKFCSFPDCLPGQREYISS
jgi:hypothetical protein